MDDPPCYHDLHITTPHIERISIFDLPYGVEVICSRVTGWQLQNNAHGVHKEILAGEYNGPEHWLVLDVAGHIIVDSRPIESDEFMPEAAGPTPPPPTASDCFAKAAQALEAEKTELAREWRQLGEAISTAAFRR